VITCGVLLAAGAGTRFGGAHHKLLSVVGGRPVWLLSLQHLLDARLDHVVVVTGAVHLDLPPSVIPCHNPDFARGQATSLQSALEVADGLGADAVVVGLADQPFIEPSAWRAVADAPAECAIAVAVYGGRRGPNPVRLARSVWPLLPLSGDEGARTVIRLHPELVCDVPCLGSVADIDTLEDLERWKNC